jgi:hypothetical protein
VCDAWSASWIRSTPAAPVAPRIKTRMAVSSMI